MANNNIDDLRAHLFETLAALRDKDKPMEIERAKAVTEVAQVIINTCIKHGVTPEDLLTVATQSLLEY